MRFDEVPQSFYKMSRDNDLVKKTSEVLRRALSELETSSAEQSRDERPDRELQSNPDGQNQRRSATDEFRYVQIINIHLDNQLFEICVNKLRELLPFSKPGEIIIVILHIQEGFSGTLFAECHTAKYF